MVVDWLVVVVVLVRLCFLVVLGVVLDSYCLVVYWLVLVVYWIVLLLFVYGICVLFGS